MNIIKILNFIKKAKDPHFIYVTKDIWNKWFWIVYPFIFFNKNYKSCIIYRRKYKFLNNIVVIGLKWSGKNVKRRTTGYAKEFLLSHKNAKCLYCDKKLNNKNATTDHIIPISEGGNNCQINLIVCCFDCNNERGSMSFMEYLKIKNPVYRTIKKPWI